MLKNCLQCLNQKSKNSAWKLKDGEQWKGRKKYRMEHQDKLKKLKLIQHCIQLTIAKNESFSKTAATFLAYDSMFVNSCCTT